MKRILVLCTGNSCRSQMAEVYLRHFSAGRAEIYSAGIETHGVNPVAITVMQEDGLDISQHTSNHIDEYKDLPFDLVITVCDHARECCPLFRGKALIIHQNFPDPAKAQGTAQDILEQFRTVRSQIRQFCDAFLQQHLSA